MKLLYSELRNSWLNSDDHIFLKNCSVESYQASGPGGQKRNKKFSAVRLTHIPTGIFVTVEIHRSLINNKKMAIKKLKNQIAYSTLGDHIHLTDFNISKSNDKYCLVVAALFDALRDNLFSVSLAAKQLGMTTSKFIKVLGKDDELWRKFNEYREKEGLKKLKKN